MKRMFLASSIETTGPAIGQAIGNPEKLKLVFIDTAGEPEEEKQWIEEDRSGLEKAGFKITDYTLTGKSAKDIADDLEGFDVIHVNGGDTFYLLIQARKSGFDKIVKELVGQGVIYAGSSAGSYLVCPTIEASNWKPADKPRFGITDLTAINLAPFIMTAHFTPEYADIIKQAASSCQYPVKILTDQQAMVVVDDKITLVGQDEEVILGTH